jgi:CDP-4-dehydro-6-deoxyglucose reductase/ferredoxin-NAD(P)+ reductase (naphthalene dioxygenase ferredoxin-specific)
MPPSEPQRVKVRQLDRIVEVAPGETILEAALASGSDYPCGCQSGNCGSCKSVLISGEVDLRPYSEFALSNEERAAGLILACQAVPRGPVEVAWLDQEEMPLHSRRTMTCRVVGVDDLTYDTRRIRLESESEPLDFSAGQYAAVAFAGLPPRDFSMANQPDDPILEFHIRAINGGAVSDHVRHGLKHGDRVTVTGPFGVSYLREKHAGPIFALAGGSGLAPIKSIIERALGIGLRQPIRLYIGVRDETDLYLEDHFQVLTHRHANFSLLPVLSSPSGATERRTGFLADVLTEEAPDLDGAKAYLAGPPAMVETCVAALRRLGIRSDNCHADAFYTEADKARADVNS